MTKTQSTPTATAPELGQYRVRFALDSTGSYARLESSQVVYAISREAAVASVPNGLGAEVLRWAFGELD